MNNTQHCIIIYYQILCVMIQGLWPVEVRRSNDHPWAVGPQGGSQYLEQHDKKSDGSIVRKKLMGVRYGLLLKIVTLLLWCLVY